MSRSVCLLWHKHELIWTVTVHTSVWYRWVSPLWLCINICILTSTACVPKFPFTLKYCLTQAAISDMFQCSRKWKGHFSINMQLVCITTITWWMLWTGSVDDSTVFDNCHLEAVFETMRAHCRLVGDGGYVCTSYMLSDINPVTATEHSYNAAHASPSNPSKATNATNSVQTRQHTIVATVLLYNIVINDQRCTHITLDMSMQLSSSRSVQIYL